MPEQFDISHTWEEPEGLHALLESIRTLRPVANLRKIRYAYFVAEKAHSGQQRSTGEPYITHPLEVAKIMVELDMDDDTVCAALLHDVLEDCEGYDYDVIQSIFGHTVAELVEGVTKLKFQRVQGATPVQRAAAENARAAETLRKMLLAMARDVRVMVIKLGDRLHNMRTLESLPPEKRVRIANETLDVYAPLAARLGIWQIKWQLEDLSFRYLHPKEFQEISDLVAKTRTDRERELNEAIRIIKENLESRHLRNVEVIGRPKHLYSIFNKIALHGFQFEEILDLLALRIIVRSTTECYLALGIVHETWLPIPNLFSDYIAKPKPNGYQSLHTKVVGPHGEPLEVQIRTHEMHRIAEFGVAAHWTYKEGGDKAKNPKNEFSMLRQALVDFNDDNRTSSDFIRSVSRDLFSEQVFAFTPKGDVIDLPAQSTPIDFAFRVHSTLGLSVVGAKVNGAIVPLSAKLQNGDVVELITRSNAQPSLDWLEFVKSSNAKSKLRAYFRKRSRSESSMRGKDSLDREVRALGLDPKDVAGEDKLNGLATSAYHCENATELLAKIGDGLVSAVGVAKKLRGLLPQEPQGDPLSSKLQKPTQRTQILPRVDNILIKRARCCDPLPGEDVVGYITRGRGLQVHRRVCPNVADFLANEPERVSVVEWEPDGNSYPIQLKIVTMNRQGLLMDISVIFGESKTNVNAARIRTLRNQTAEIVVVIEVTDINRLNALLNKISNFGDVISIMRVFGRGTKG